MSKLTIQIKTSATEYTSHWDGLIFPIISKKTTKFNHKLLASMPNKLRQRVGSFIDKSSFRIGPEKATSFDTDPGKRVVILGIPSSQTMFESLAQAKAVSLPLHKHSCKHILCDLRGLGELAFQWSDALVSHLEALLFSYPKTSEDKVESKKPRKVVLLCDEDQKVSIKRIAMQAQTITQGTNLVRLLTTMPGNQLTPKELRREGESRAKELGLSTSFYSITKLRSMKAGAFLAVPQGSNHTDSGILKISYKAKTKHKNKKHLTLVGKGITYDTGGVNLKPPAYMFGMQGDMGGAAVALASILTAKRLEWPVDVTAYLAIADNAIGQNAYRPNDVVTSLSGKTIEIVHTDAEGRMILADTLTLASQEKTDLIVDFATLTGSCIAAIGTTYSGAFTNQGAYHNLIRAAGESSGERLWTFPLDKDFGKCLESEVADIKQCRLKGGVDHIEAAFFLKQFIENQTPWVHFDLSSAENDGGLAHIDTDVTGVGVRFTHDLVQNILLSEDVETASE